MSEALLEISLRRLRRRLWTERIVFMTVLASVGGAWLYPTAFPSVWAAYVDGKPVVALRDRGAMEAALAQVKRAQAGSSQGVAFLQQVKVDRANPRKVEVTDVQTAVERLADSVQLRGPRAVIYIDDTPVVALPDEDAAGEVLDSVKETLSKGVEVLDGEPEFKQKVEVKTEPADQDSWADKETALGLLMGEEGEQQKQHTIQRGESAYTIAKSYGLATAELQRLNPGVTLPRIHPGQKLNVGSGPEPLLTVLVEGKTTQTLATPYPSIKRVNPKLYEGKQFVKQPGRPGRQLITYQMRYENGRATERQVIARKTLAAAQPEILTVGGKPRPGNER